MTQVAAALLMCGWPAWGATQGGDVIGLWYVEGGYAAVEIERCGSKLCGSVAWLRQPFDPFGCYLTDANNPSPSLRNRSLLGLEILSGFVRDDAGGHRWTNGAIYDPDSGNTYRSTIVLDGSDTLKVRGYIGIPLLGRTTTWTRELPRRPCS